TTLRLLEGRTAMGDRERSVRVGMLSLGAAALVWTLTAQSRGVVASGQSADPNNQARGAVFTSPAAPDDEGPPLRLSSVQNLTEALAGFDNLTNGFLPQGPDFDTLNEDNVAPLQSFNDNRFVFEEVEQIKDGLGPTYNAQSCRECHQNVVTGGAS